GPDGTVIASSDRGRFPPGSPFPLLNQPGWSEVTTRALSGERDTARLSWQQGNGPAFGAYPVIDYGADRTVAAVAISKQSTLPRDVPNLLGRTFAAWGVASAVVLAVSSIFALTFSGIAAYLIARRLGGRLERLSQ